MTKKPKAPEPETVWMWYSNAGGWYPWIWGATPRVCREKAEKQGIDYGKPYRATITLAEPKRKKRA